MEFSVLMVYDSEGFRRFAKSGRGIIKDGELMREPLQLAFVIRDVHVLVQTYLKTFSQA